MAQAAVNTERTRRYFVSDDLTLRLSISMSTLYGWVRTGRFPKPILLGGTRRKFWPVEVVEAWEREQAAKYGE